MSGRSGRQGDVLTTLKSAAVPMTIVQIADRLGVHPNTVRFHLDNLTADGRVERVQPEGRGPGRPPSLFRAVRRMDPGGPRRYEALAEILTISLAAAPDARSKALEGGRAWGRGLASDKKTGTPRRRLLELLDELGFAPERVARDTVGLRHCPFLELAERTSDVVCPIHLGIMQGALERWHAPVTVDRLEAFVKPDLCVAHLAEKGTTT